ncbi:MAG TPA: DUF5689 domain-containing protein, partial [Chryseolinea sp.]|nr:DUF5689 domain-containing protein [Chryseolinea sp.]
MKFNFLKSIATVALFSAALTGCIKDDDFAEPVIECAEVNLTANKEVADLYAVATGLPAQYAAEDIIEAYVTSSDERGNFFKSVSFQTNPTDGSAPLGFSVAIDETGLFAKKFTVGRKVFVKLKDLYFAKIDGSLKIGQLFESTVGRIAEAEYASKVIPSCVIVEEDELVRTLTIQQAKNDINLNTLIELENVQFKDEFVGGTYYDEDSDLGGASNRL